MKDQFIHVILIMMLPFKLASVVIVFNFTYARTLEKEGGRCGAGRDNENTMHRYRNKLFNKKKLKVNYIKLHY